MKQRFDVIVAGAGASGLMAGIQAARHGAAVLILEHMDPLKTVVSVPNLCNFPENYKAVPHPGWISPG